MAGGSTSSREQNFWPGFVDALTNVVLVMVFIVVAVIMKLFFPPAPSGKVVKIQAKKTESKRRSPRLRIVS